MSEEPINRNEDLQEDVRELANSNLKEARRKIKNDIDSSRQNAGSKDKDIDGESNKKEQIKA